MFHSDLCQEAIHIFNNTIREIESSRIGAFQDRKKFVNHFTIDRIRQMSVEDYVLGIERSDDDLNFCHFLERKLNTYGKMLGGTAKKFGFYYGAWGHDLNRKYRFTKEVGGSIDIALARVKENIIDLILAGKNGDKDKILQNPLSPMFKGKILATYYPKNYLNIFSRAHLEFHINKVEAQLPGFFKQDEVILREKLLSYKDTDPIMKNWTIEMYSTFLYDYFGHPPKKNQPINSNVEIETGNIIFPQVQIPEEVSLEILPQSEFVINHSGDASSRKIDYVRKNKVDSIIGLRGEELVRLFEINRLSNDFDRFWLEENIKIVSKDSDHFGYDVLSIDSDMSPRYIEVKTTRHSIDYSDFYISANELDKARTLSNYFIYRVYDVLNINPKIWIIGNPFNPENLNIKLTPTNFKVSINAKV